MGLHELFTNALKYGALMREEGRIAVGWTLGPGPERPLILEWRETVAPDASIAAPPTPPPTREGFGTRLIRQVFTYDLGGTVEFDHAPTGLTWEAYCELKEIVRAEAPVLSKARRRILESMGREAAAKAASAPTQLPLPTLPDDKPT